NSTIPHSKPNGCSSRGVTDGGASWYHPPISTGVPPRETGERHQTVAERAAMPAIRPDPRRRHTREARSTPMEMEYKDTNRRGQFVIIVGVVLALAAGGAAYFLINQAQQSGPGVVEKVAVAVAAQV